MAVLVVAVAAVVLAPEQPVTACGPDFPTNTIVRRADALATMWDGSFVEEAAKLVVISDRERAELTAAPVQIPASAREQALYSAAAEQFHAGELDAAGRGFLAVLRLPAKDRGRLSVAAAYSLGRVRDAQYRTLAAIAAYRQVRTLVRAGFADDGGLATSSLGQEARDERVQRDDLVAAVHLYARQSALGDQGGAISLLSIIRGAAPGERSALYQDDVGTRLVALYFYTRRSEIEETEQATWRRELAKHATTEARGAGYMAAAAYRNGEWDSAAALASRCRHSPIATWVQAKLALRDGDRARAEVLLREVEQARLAGNPLDSDLPAYSLDEDPRSLVRAELGLLALADQRFAEAADWFARGTRMVEAAYVAERVMSPDELLVAVQHTQDARRAGPPHPVDEEEEACNFWEPAVGEHAYCWGKGLLEIYARRLLRLHRYDEALDAFADAAPAESAKEFIAAMKRAEATSGIERAEHLYDASRTLRRQGMEIAGTEVGPDWHVYDGDFERETLCMPSPTAGYSTFAKPETDEYQDPSDGCTLPTRADAAFVSPLEAARVASSAPELDQRFSYRYAASRLAETAANLVPPRSQAYGQALCWAALYARRDRTRVDELYATYLRNGAAGLGGEFGESCDEPDFRAARTFEADQQNIRFERTLAAARANAWTWPRIRAAAWRHKRWLALPMIALALILLVRRRHSVSLGAM